MSNNVLLTHNPGLNDVASDRSLDVSDNITVSMEFAIEEDIEAELQEFSQLIEKGALVSAFTYFDDVLKEHIHLFPVLAEFADLLIECRDYDRLKDVLNTLSDTFVGEEQLIIGKFRALAEIGAMMIKAAKPSNTAQMLGAITTSRSWLDLASLYDKKNMSSKILQISYDSKAWIIEAIQKSAEFCSDELILKSTSTVGFEHIRLKEVKDKQIPVFDIILQAPSIPLDDWQLHYLELHYRIAVLVVQLFAMYHGESSEVSKACHQIFTVSVDTIRFLLKTHNSRQALRMLDVVIQVADSSSAVEIAERAIWQSVGPTSKILARFAISKAQPEEAIVSNLKERWENGRALFGADTSAFWSDGYLRGCVQRNDTVAMRRWTTLVDNIDTISNTWIHPSILKPAEKVLRCTVQELFHCMRRCRHTDPTGWQAFLDRALIDYCANPDAIPVVLEAGAQLTAEALCAASELGNRETIALLLNIQSHEVQNGPLGAKALGAASAGGHLELVVDLLNYGVDPDPPAADGQTAIEKAATNGHRNIMELLLSRGAKPSSTTGFINAAEKGHVDVVKLLLEHGVQIGRPGRHAWMTLGSVAREGHTEVVELLLPQSTEEGRNSALKTAALFGYAKIIQKLLDYGADVNHRDDRGRVAIELAAAWDHVDVVKILVARGADIKDMESALEAARKNYRDNADALLQKAIAAHYKKKHVLDTPVESDIQIPEPKQRRWLQWLLRGKD